MSKHHRVSPRDSRPRALRYETLEDRRLLAVVTVDTNQDVVDFADGVTSLREAIFATNPIDGTDEIQFDFGHDGPETIALTLGELAITDSLIITGPGADLLTIDASGNDPTPDSNPLEGDFTGFGDGSRIFNIDDGDRSTNFDVEIHGLTLTDADVRGEGGAILSRENLLVIDSTISDNSAIDGGGIQSSGLSVFNKLTVINTTISGNLAFRKGGGIRAAGMITITDSTISDNSSAFGTGGGIFISHSSTTIIDSSTISGNSALGPAVASGPPVRGPRLPAVSSREIRRAQAAAA